MRKVMLVIVTVLLTFTLVSCVEEEEDITVIVFSNNPNKTIEDLDELPMLLATEISQLGIQFNRIVVQSSNDVSAIEESLLNGEATIALLNPSMVQSDSLKRVLHVVMDEIDHPDGNKDHTTYQQAIVVSNTVKGEMFMTGYNTAPVHTLLNGLTICSTFEEGSFVEDYAISLGATSIDDVSITHDVLMTSEIYSSLENGSCDMAVVTLEEVRMYSQLWQENESVYESLSVVHTFEPIYYEGFYAANDGEEVHINALMQSLIQISSHSVNSEILTALGHKSYYINK